MLIPVQHTFCDMSHRAIFDTDIIADEYRSIPRHIIVIGTKNLTGDNADFAGRHVGSPAKQSLRLSSLQVSRKTKAFQRLHFSSSLSFINI